MMKFVTVVAVASCGVFFLQGCKSSINQVTDLAHLYINKFDAAAKSHQKYDAGGAEKVHSACSEVEKNFKKDVLALDIGFTADTNFEGLDDIKKQFPGASQQEVQEFVTEMAKLSSASFRCRQVVSNLRVGQKIIDHDWEKDFSEKELIGQVTHILHEYTGKYAAAAAIYEAENFTGIDEAQAACWKVHDDLREVFKKLNFDISLDLSMTDTTNLRNQFGHDVTDKQIYDFVYASQTFQKSFQDCRNHFELDRPRNMTVAGLDFEIQHT